jgi:DNA modification methylase
MNNQELNQGEGYEALQANHKIVDLKIQLVPVSELIPADYNPRKWSKEQLEQITQSIKRFNMVDPLIANRAPNRKNRLIGGHMRLIAAKQLGVKEVPVIYVNIPDIDREKELNLRLNKNTGSWDYELLKAFDIELLLDVGFNDEDLSNIWDENLSIEDDEFNIEEELTRIRTPETKEGEIYQLGNHILGCGDATDSDFVDRLIGSARIDMIYFDPPYNISLSYDNGIGARSKYGGLRTNDNKSREEYKKFLKVSFLNSLPKAKDDFHAFCYCDEIYIGLIQDIYSETGIDVRRVCIWIKNNQTPTPQVAFNKVYEPCIYGNHGSPYLSDSCKNLNEIFNKEISTGNRCIDDIYDMFNIWLAKRIPTIQYSHPTEKPPSLHERPLRRCTRVGDVVLDLFAGSGSTLIACEQMKRRCITSDFEPIFCDLIIRRYEQLTGIGAERIV